MESEFRRHGPDEGGIVAGFFVSNGICGVLLSLMETSTGKDNTSHEDLVISARSEQVEGEEKNRVASIVEYDERKAAVNAYPERIVSPPDPSDCCSSNMEQVGKVQEDGNWLYAYKRCRVCGYTVRHVLMLSPEALRKMRGEILRTLN